MSLRKFVEAGMDILLNNEVLKLSNRETGEVIIEGIYDKPNWTVSLVVQREKEGNIEYDQYIYIANLVNLEEEIELR